MDAPRFGEVFHWPGDPREQVCVYLCPDPKTGGWIVLWLNRDYGEPTAVEDNITDDGWDFVGRIG